MKYIIKKEKRKKKVTVAQKLTVTKKKKNTPKTKPTLLLKIKNKKIENETQLTLSNSTTAQLHKCAFVNFCGGPGRKHPGPTTFFPLSLPTKHPLKGFSSSFSL